MFVGVGVCGWVWLGVCVCVGVGGCVCGCGGVGVRVRGSVGMWVCGGVKCGSVGLWGCEEAGACCRCAGQDRPQRQLLCQGAVPGRSVLEDVARHVVEVQRAHDLRSKRLHKGMPETQSLRDQVHSVCQTVWFAGHERRLEVAAES